MSEGLRFLRGIALALFVIGCLVAVLARFGVTTLQSSLYFAYEAIYVLVPGWLCYFICGGRHGSLIKQIAIGWGVGYALVTLASIVFSACGRSQLFWTYPILILLLLSSIYWIRFRTTGWAELRETFRSSLDARFAWVISFFAVLALVYLVLSAYRIYPLPQAAEKGVTYYVDLPFAMSTTAEAKYHWPITDPRISGQPFRYYTFVYTHMATISRITGLNVPVIVLRLFPAVFNVVFVLQLFVLGLEVSGSYLVGALTILMTIFVGQINPFLPMDFPFLNSFLYDTYLSPTYSFGLVLFVPLVIVALDLFREGKATTNSPGNWCAFSLLLIGIGGAKGAALLVFTAGSVGFLVWRSGWKRELHPASLVVVLSALAVTWFYLHFIYDKFAGTGQCSPLSAIPYVPFIQHYLPWVISPNPHILGTILALFIVMLGNLNLRFIAVVWFVFTRGLSFSLAQAWLMMLFAAGIAPWLLLDYRVTSGFLYFLFFGYVAGSVLGAEFLAHFWQQLKNTSIPRRVFSCALLTFLLLAGIVDYPFQQVRLYKRARNIANHGVNNVPDLTPALLEALQWVRDNSSVDDVLAVSNQFLFANAQGPSYMCYSAFSERRVFLEGWAYSNSFLAKESHVYLDRLKINQRVFQEGDAAAAEVMATQYGVTHLLVDKVHSKAYAALSKFATLVYENPDVQIYALAVPSKSAL